MNLHGPNPNNDPSQSNITIKMPIYTYDNANFLIFLQIVLNTKIFVGETLIYNNMKRILKERKNRG